MGREIGREPEREKNVRKLKFWASGESGKREGAHESGTHKKLELVFFSKDSLFRMRYLYQFDRAHFPFPFIPKRDINSKKEETVRIEVGRNGMQGTQV